VLAATGADVDQSSINTRHRNGGQQKMKVTILVGLLAEKGIGLILRASGLAEVPEVQEVGNILQWHFLKKIID
jgi:hypothetical protein